MWFPRHKGFVTGITMAGFGGGAALVSQIAGRLIANHGWTTFHAFQLFGAVFFLVVVTAGMFMRFPQPVSGTPHQTLSFSEVFHRRLFWLLYATMFTGLVAGFMVNANMTKLYTGPENIEAGILAVSAFAITNAVGRLTWGYIFDRIKTSTAIRLNLLSQGLLLLAGLWILRFPVGLVVFALLAGFNYGGLLVIHASSSARHWEGQHVGQVYGWLSSSNIPAALSPIAAGWVHNRTQTFSGPLLVVSLALILVGLFFSFRIEKHVSGTDH